MPAGYDALLVVSFGGPEGMGDVMPFLENVLRGRNVPPERVRLVASHYEHFGGRSPINDQCRALIAALEAELQRHGPRLPIYWGNRNWHPLLADAVSRMSGDGVRRALAFATSAFGSYSGCRQYLEDIARAREAVGPAAPEIHKLRGFHDHPGYIEPLVENVASALGRLGPDQRAAARLVFTAHGIPLAMAAASPYEAQVRETAQLVASRVGWPHWTVAYQSRSGSPGQPWLEPDLFDELRAFAEDGAKAVVVAPIGFISDHMEVCYDLDVDAKARADALGLEMIRAATVGSHPRFVSMIRELIEERLTDAPVRASLGVRGPAPDFCPEGCCRPGRAEASRGSA